MRILSHEYKICEIPAAGIISLSRIEDRKEKEDSNYHYASIRHTRRDFRLENASRLSAILEEVERTLFQEDLEQGRELVEVSLILYGDVTTVWLLLAKLGVMYPPQTLSVSLSISVCLCLSVSVYLRRCLCQSVSVGLCSLYVYIALSLSVYLSLSLSVYLCLPVSVCLSLSICLCLFVYILLPLSVSLCVSICLALRSVSLCISLCLPVCKSLS